MLLSSLSSYSYSLTSYLPSRFFIFYLSIALALCLATRSFIELVYIGVFSMKYYPYLVLLFDTNNFPYF